MIIGLVAFLPFEYDAFESFAVDLDNLGYRRKCVDRYRTPNQRDMHALFFNFNFSDYFKGNHLLSGYFIKYNFGCI